jgi:hypothetical protein
METIGNIVWAGWGPWEPDAHGVGCGQSRDGGMMVMDLDLCENNLAGEIPKEIGQLRSLTSLNLMNNRLIGAIPRTLKRLTLCGNHLSGLAPDLLIQRWLDGRPDISAETPLLTDMSEVDFESTPSAVPCAGYRINLRSDDRVVSCTERCRNDTPRDRTTYGELKEGHIGRGEFAMLGWMAEKSGFFGLSAEYSRSTTDATFDKTRVAEKGKVHAVSNYARSGPLELWMIQRAIEGVAASAERDKTGTRQKCPRQ